MRGSGKTCATRSATVSADLEDHAILEHDWKSFLAAHGIRVPGAVFVPRGAGDAVARIGTLAGPFAVKAVSAAIVHKSDVGAVRLGVPDAAAAVRTMTEMTESLRARGLEGVEGFIVEQMVEPGVELVLGVMNDAIFGRLLAFGMGGIAVEAMANVTFFALPLRVWDVETLMASTPALTAALRRTGPLAHEAVRELLWRVGGPDGLGMDTSIEDVEMNPVIVNRHGAIAVDARGHRA